MEKTIESPNLLESYGARLRQKLFDRVSSKIKNLAKVDSTIDTTNETSSIRTQNSATAVTSNQVDNNKLKLVSEEQISSSRLNEDNTTNRIPDNKANTMKKYRNRLLSYILEQFMMSSDVNEDEYEEESLIDEKLNDYVKFGLFKFKKTGSSAEGLFIPFPNHVKSDIDLMFEFPNIYVVDPEQFQSIDKEQYKVDEQTRFLYIDYNNLKYPCYISLYWFSKQELSKVSEKTDSSFRLPDSNAHFVVKPLAESCKRYFPSTVLVEWIATKWPIDKTHNENLEIHGPSMCTTSSHPDLPLPTDHVVALKCIHWPKPALYWITRKRPSNWPNHNLINSLIRLGCHVVPVSHASTKEETRKYEWRLSFSMCEMMLVKTLNYYQKKCYLIVKALFDVHIKQDLELSKVICSYFLKTMLFWLCESIGKEKWTYETLYDRFIDFIDYAITCFEKQYLKHYFIPEMNIIDHLETAHLKKCIDKCILMKTDLLNMIRICEEYYWNTNQFLRFTPIIDVLKENGNLQDTSCIILCCAITMRLFIEQHKLVDRPLKMVHDCIKRNYLEYGSEESIRYLLYVTSLIVDLFEGETVFSVENLLAHEALIKICESKSIYEHSYEDMKATYIKIQSFLQGK